MKKLYLLVAVIWMLALPFCVNAQVSTLGHTGGIADYVGWDNSQAFPLLIKHEGNQLSTS
jgi:hypothetical protein